MLNLGDKYFVNGALKVDLVTKALSDAGTTQVAVAQKATEFSGLASEKVSSLQALIIMLNLGDKYFVNGALKVDLVTKALSDAGTTQVAVAQKATEFSGLANEQ